MRGALSRLSPAPLSFPDFSFPESMADRNLWWSAMVTKFQTPTLAEAVVTYLRLNCWPPTSLLGQVCMEEKHGMMHLKKVIVADFFLLLLFK